jgi:hypothetical protein
MVLGLGLKDKQEWTWPSLNGDALSSFRWWCICIRGDVNRKQKRVVGYKDKGREREGEQGNKK